MAKRPALIKLKSKKKTKSKQEQFLVNSKAYGGEPVYTSKELNASQLTQAYNWYNYMCETKEAKEFLVEYLKNTNRTADLRAVRAIPDKFIPSTICWIARMRSQGAILPDKTKNYFETRLQEAISDGQRRAENEQPEPEDGMGNEPKKPTVQDRMAALYDHLACQVEVKIDDFLDNWKSEFSMFDFLQANEVSQQIAKQLHDKYNPELEDIELAYHGKVEGYEGYTKDHLEKLYGFYVMLVEDIEQYQNNKKKTRKPRKPKTMTTEKLLKDFKYKEFDNVFKIQSVYPSEVVGALELWTFNCKYNQLTVFRASDPIKGLSVHRTAIINYDESSSVTKKIRANRVDGVLRELQAAGKVSLRKFMDTVNGSDQKLQQRMNENTVLVRVVKK
jgi:hypothetical protein